jgi:folylpolyglutamate synthase/dihydropteroate synthase
MLNFDHLENLEEIADNLKDLLKYCEVGDRLDVVDAYTKVCTAISQIHMDYQQYLAQDFLQIGNHIIRKTDIVRVEIEEANERYNNPKRVVITIRDVDASEGHGSWSKQIKFNHDSKEAALLLCWIADQTEKLGMEEKEPAKG